MISVDLDQVTLFFLSFTLSMIGYAFLYKLRSFSPSHMLRKLLYVPVGKSLTNSQSLGGFVLLNSTVILFTLQLMNNFRNYSIQDISTFASFIFASAIILSYGYLDDCHEVKARYKLLAQFLISCVLGALGLMIFESSVMLIASGCMFFFCMASLNGANLMDGADTISVKVGSSIFLYYFVLGSFYEVTIVSELSLLGVGSLFAFYFFNRFPSKIHLGEIGGAFLGLLYVFLATLSCLHLMSSHSTELAISNSLFPLVFPVGELGITFCRRLYFRKSVFAGDQFHLHHILINYFKLSVVSCANVFGLVSFISLAIQMGANIILPTASVYSSSLLCIGLAVSYILLGHSIWRKASRVNQKSSLDHMFKMKKIELLSAKVIDDFEFSIKTESTVIEEELLEDDSLDKKKAS